MSDTETDDDTPAKGTIKIPRDDFERHNDRRKDLRLSWAEYINGVAPDTAGTDADVSEQLDRIESAATTTEERVAELERTLTEVTQR